MEHHHHDDKQQTEAHHQSDQNQSVQTPDESEIADPDKVKELLAKEDQQKRTLSGFWHIIALTLCAGMSGFYIYTAGTLPAPIEWQRGLYVLLTFVLIFTLYPFFPHSGPSYKWFRGTFGEKVDAATSAGPLKWLRRIIAPRHGPSLFDLVLIALTMLVVGYYIIEFKHLQFRAGNYNDTDMIMGAIGLIVCLEVSRRVLGWAMTLIGIAFLLYLHFGESLYDLPVLDAFAHRGQDWDRIVTKLFFDQEGVFGVMANVLVSYVILFIFFGAFLQKSGASRFFLDLPLALAGRTTGGPAKVAVISSALFGSISGSAIANTVSTGAFTIPLMKRAGFKPHVAGAIEPAASIGGMFMPPVMGAGAFLMSELTSIPYAQIVLVSIFPAILYFTSVLTMVHFEAKKQKLSGIDTGVRPMDIIKRDWYLSLPLIIIVSMLIGGFSPGYAAFWSIVFCVLLMFTMPNNAADFRISALFSLPLFTFVLLVILGYSTGSGFWFWPFDKDTIEPVIPALFWSFIIFVSCAAINLRHKASLSQRWDAFCGSSWRVLRTSFEAMVEGALGTLVIGATVGVIGIIVGTIFATGVGLRFSDIIVSLSNGNLLLAIALVGLASLVLGMGVPVTASYLIVTVLAVPALQELGVALIAAHMIVYWFSQDSNITPPVCVAAYAGAAIAGADPWKTGWTSFKFAKLLYVMPLLFAYSPAILLVGETGEILTDLQFYDVVLAYASGFIGTVAFSAATMGYLVRKTTWWEWLIFAGGTFLCFFPNIPSDIAGVLIICAVWFWQKYDVKRQEMRSEAETQATQLAG
ncbi:MAG: TRAP transporter permease [Chloroflexaceae bacterium]|nr:TRAP transporter permease [Chloroflexaceae bacterium]